jgi:hypothetical protein
MILSGQVTSPASFFLFTGRSHCLNTSGDRNTLKLPRWHKVELYAFQSRILYLLLVGFIDRVLMYLLLLLGENKDKSINPFFIVATMPVSSGKMVERAKVT